MDGMDLHRVKRIVFNQMINNQSQVEHIKAFMEIAIRNPKRKFRLIMEEVESVEIDTNADTKVMATLRPV